VAPQLLYPEVGLECLLGDGNGPFVHTPVLRVESTTLSLSRTNRVEPPVAVALFPKDIPMPPQALAERGLNKVRSTAMPKGGHFCGDGAAGAACEGSARVLPSISIGAPRTIGPARQSRLIPKQDPPPPPQHRSREARDPVLLAVLLSIRKRSGACWRQTSDRRRINNLQMRRCL